MNDDFKLDTDLELEDALEELSSAEDFLEFFQVKFDAKVVQVNRLHIMQRFHDYLEEAKASLEGLNDEALAKIYRALLTQAYTDFIDSDAKTEKVLKIYKMQGPQTTFVSADAIFEQ